MHSHEHHDHGHDGCTATPATNKDDIIDDEETNNNEVLRRLYMATVLCTIFLLVEAIGGYLAGSLAILSDAAHLFADLASFAVAIVAAHLAQRPASTYHTYGLQRTESLAALFSMASLAVVSIGLALEAIRRLWTVVIVQDGDLDVDGKLMSLVATIGVVVNILLALVLGEHHTHMPGAEHDGHSHDHHHHVSGSNDGQHSHDDHSNDEHQQLLVETAATAGDDYGGTTDILLHSDEVTPPRRQSLRNVNLKAAYIHVMGDLAQSAAVLIAGIIIWFQPHWQIVDPIATLFFCSIVFYSTLGVLRSSVAVLLEEVPPHLSWQRIYDEIAAVNGVTNVHDLHVWSISHGIPTLSVHATAKDIAQAMEDISDVCRLHHISHATIQLQPDTIVDCITCTETNIKCKSAD